MKRTSFADPVKYTKGQNTVPSDLDLGIDTRGNGYIAWARHSVVIITTQDTKDKALRVPFEATVTVPYSLGDTAAQAALAGFFTKLGTLKFDFDGTTSTAWSSCEAYTRILAEIPNIVVLTEVAGAAAEPKLTDVDHVPTVLN